MLQHGLASKLKIDNFFRFVVDIAPLTYVRGANNESSEVLTISSLVEGLKYKVTASQEVKCQQPLTIRYSREGKVG